MLVGQRGSMQGVPMESDSRTDKRRKDHLCLKHWLVLARVTWGEMRVSK